MEKVKNNFFRVITLFAAISVIIVMIGIFISLFYESLPVLKQTGLFSFIASPDWNYGAQSFGGAIPLLGTLTTTIIALVFAVPIALGVSIFLTELCPHKLRGSIGTGIELLAAIPSIIYGMWGLFVLAPVMERYIQPLFAKTLGALPIVGAFFKTDAAGGLNIFTASIILGIMIIPFISSIARDAFLQISPFLKESAYGIGSTKWEMIKDILIPQSKVTIAGGIVIAMGRALGETMAVTYVIGNRLSPLKSIFDPFATITSVLANEFNEASGMHMSAIFMLAFTLFIVNVVVLSFAKYILRRQKK